MSLQAAIAALRTTLRTIDGLRVYDNPPESINEFPSAVVYPGRGEMATASAGLARNVHTVMIQILHSRVVLPEAMAAAVVWPDTLQAALNADPYLGGAISNYVWPLLYLAGPIRYAPSDPNDRYGITFELKLKIEAAI